MSKSIKNIATATVIVIMLIGAYYLGTTQAKTETVETVPQGYISLDKCIPLDTEYQNDCIDMKQVTDFTATENSLQLYTTDGNGYYWEK